MIRKTAFSQEIWTFLKKAQKDLENIGLTQEEARHEACLLVASVLRLKPLEVYVYPKPLRPLQRQRLWSLLEERLSGRPLAYVLGEVEFFGRPFYVAPGVLIPRPETEILVETVLRYLPKGHVILLELGVGSGIISLTLALEHPEIYVIGVEKSPQALKVAQKNRKRLGLEKRVHFVQGNWLTPFRPKPHFWALVSNPPYIAAEEWEHLDKEVRQYEPQEALLAGEKGLDFIKETLTKAPAYLLPKGFVFLEIGYRQAAAVKEIAQALAYNTHFQQDLSGHQRVLVAQYDSKFDLALQKRREPQKI